jgi:two-component system LytT family response regulator
MIETLKIRSVIVDDEQRTRRALRRLMAHHPEMDLIDECSDGYQAIAAIRLHSPDLVFLDVEMPEVDGFAVLESVAQEPPPLVIFVTAHPKYACRAFDVPAVDYLLKPFDRKRFNIALQRAKDKLAAGRSIEVNQRVLALLEKLSDAPRYVERLLVKTKERAFYVKTNELDWIEAAGKHVQLHVGREWYELREAICSLEAKLNPKKFRRIHRSTIVNVDRVKEIVPWFHGYLVILKDGTELHLSRDYRKNLMDF